MVTLSILVILVGIAVPSFREMLLDNRRTTTVNELLSNLMLARSEAVKRGRPVSICAAVPGGTASCAGGADWSRGWLVFVDADGNGDIAAVSDVLRQSGHDAASVGIRIVAATGGPGHFTLRPFNQAGTAGNITVCDSRGPAHGRRICVQSNGRARVTDTACDGTALSCP